jgi:predicted secreted Zn-dependent protease
MEPMMNPRTWAMAAAAVAGIICWDGTALAKPTQTTKYTYYTIAGDSAVEIYNSMMKKGPKVNGAKAYAATSATTTQNGKLSQGSSCRIEDYRLKLDFVIKLPKIRNEKVLPAADRKRWQQFAGFLKAHEETHREIWLGCAADLERQVKSIKARSCDEADRKANLLWDKIRASCNKKHAAFDAAEQKKLMSHPFVKMVYKRSTSVRGAAAN